MGVLVPNLVPDGAEPGLPMAAGSTGRPPIGESHLGPKKSAQAAPGFTRQAVGIRLAGGSLDQDRRADRRELTTIGLAD
jgi:hypothetical protein